MGEIQLKALYNNLIEPVIIKSQLSIDNNIENGCVLIVHGLIRHYLFARVDRWTLNT